MNEHNCRDKCGRVGTSVNIIDRLEKVLSEQSCSVLDHSSTVKKLVRIGANILQEVVPFFLTLSRRGFQLSAALTQHNVPSYF